MEDNEYVRNAMLSTITNEGLRKEYESVHNTLSSWLPRLREVETEIGRAKEQFIQS